MHEVKMYKVTCPYCGREFAIDISQLIERKGSSEVESELNIEIHEPVKPLPKYYTRKKDGMRLPNLPYPLSRDDIEKKLDEYQKIVDEGVEEIVEVTGKINGKPFKVRVWHFKYPNDIYYSHIAYVIKGNIKGKPMRTKDIRWVKGKTNILRIPPVGLSSNDGKRHKLDHNEISEIMKYFGDTPQINSSGELVINIKDTSLMKKEVLKKLLTVWYAFYARYDV